MAIKKTRGRPGTASTRKPTARPRTRSKAAAAAPAAVRPSAAKPGAETGPAPPVVVGIGASAGGLEAFSHVLRNVRADSGAALVLVQHLAPQHESALVPLLAAHTPLPVVQVSDGLHVEANHVYVIPPNAQMSLVEGTLRLARRPSDRSQYAPIDHFFTTLAESLGPRAIAVVLSGTASDGAIGLAAIKSAGGITLAQRPDTAKYDGMPRAAVGTGLVDFVLPPEEIGTKLVELAQSTPIGGEIRIGERELHRIFDLLRPVSGVDFRHYKLPTIKRRLFRRMGLHRLTDLRHYIRLLESNPGEVRRLYEDLLIHVTRFFREPDSFQALARSVFPALVDQRPPEQPIRAWVSGCATGEEAYSLAITLHEYLHEASAQIPIQIFATDVSESAIEHARAGQYQAAIEADVSAERLRRFFTRQNGGYRVSKAIRDVCVFARQDLTKDPPFSRLDLIICRNVLIYMDAVLQRKLLSVFHYALRPHGFLMLGQAETVGAQATLFSLVDKKHRIHRKKETPGLPTMAFPVEYALAGLPRKKAIIEVPAAEKALQGEVSRLLLDRYAPAGVVVDGDLQIVQFRGHTGAFLEPAPGDASLNLLKMAREGLLHGLRAAMHTARKSRQPVRKEGLQVRVDQAWKPVNLEVIPLVTAGRLHFVVLFDEPARRKGGDGAGRAAPKGARPKQVARGERQTQLELLQRELAASREYLQSIIQELEAANEELQSANEEILSSNEELQSTNEELDTAKEELQSTNEELNTVNEELHGRNEELSRVNSDLLNLVGSVQIAIVIVGADLRIRRFTPMAEKILNLIPSDLDRSIAHIKPNIDCPDLEQLMAECIDKVAPVEREVKDRQGRWYSLRIRPYKSVENKIDGAVLALFDVEPQTRLEEALRPGQIVDTILHVSTQAVAIVDQELRIAAASPAFATLLGQDGRLAGRPLEEFAALSWPFDRLRRLLDGDPTAVLTTRLEGAPKPWRLRAAVSGAPDGPRLVIVALDEEAPV
jgi:two-component system CheB/CheR fusion protein